MPTMLRSVCIAEHQDHQVQPGSGQQLTVLSQGEAKITVIQEAIQETPPQQSGHMTGNANQSASEPVLSSLGSTNP